MFSILFAISGILISESYDWDNNRAKPLVIKHVKRELLQNTAAKKATVSDTTKSRMSRMQKANIWIMHSAQIPILSERQRTQHG